MIHSMTAFASSTGTLGPASWSWEMRGVNARGLDLRLRLPDGTEGLEAALRAALGKALARGNVTVNLRLSREETASALAVDDVQLDAVLRALDAVQERAFAMGVTLAQPTAADVLGQRGVLIPAKTDDQAEDLANALIADIAPLIADFVRMRETEGQAMRQVIAGHLAKIETLTSAAAEAADARAPHPVGLDLDGALQVLARQDREVVCPVVPRRRVDLPADGLERLEHARPEVAVEALGPLEHQVL